MYRSWAYLLLFLSELHNSSGKKVKNINKIIVAFLKNKIEKSFLVSWGYGWSMTRTLVRGFE